MTPQNTARDSCRACRNERKARYRREQNGLAA